ncbi:MAG: CAP domain-containing protein, partial [Planctomycetes bacterium]|nr:CAP domain-containing protein [Planctomycetota bacterium]
EFKQAVLDRVQWYRAMAGVDPRIQLDLQSNRFAQEAALVMAANYELSHEPDDSWACYSSDAYEGASHSNLHLGYYGPKAIDSYIEDDGTGNEEVGHRRWILDPSLTTIGTGDTTSSNALWVINESERPNSTVREPTGFVMWPPRGFVPRNTIHERWSISHPTADFSSATIEVSTGTQSREITNYIVSDNSMGSRNALIFTWQRPSSNVKEVTITVRRIRLAGTDRNLSYVVKPIN